MIISCSRRTDVPAFYPDRLYERFREGFVEAANPYNPKQVARVDLRPEAVDAIVFWTRNPRPTMKYLDFFEDNFRFYFLLTLNAYPKTFETERDDADKSLDAFRDLSERIGPERTIWRYDPIILSEEIDRDFHLKNFDRLSGKLTGYSRKIITSVLAPYKKTLRRMRKVFPDFSPEPETSPKIRELLFEMNEIAETRGFSLEICSSGEDFRDVGVEPARCVDPELLNNIFGLNLDYKKDRNQRGNCLCSVSKDIGANNSCLAGCKYCYATASDASARKNFRKPVAPGRMF